MSLWPLCFLAACTSQNYAVMRVGEPMSPVSMLVRLHDVAFPLLVAAAEWCPFEQEPTYGFLLKDEETLQGQGGEGTEVRAAVAYVHPRLPAALAGLVPGDQVMQVNAKSVTGRGAEEVMRLVRRMTVARIQPLQLDIVRAGDHHTFYMWGTPACQFSVQLIENDQINGIANGRQVGVTTGAMRFLRSDDELAWVLAHEIAHNVLNHSQNARLHVMLHAFLSATTGIPGDLAGTIPPRRSLEARADYVGAYIMARAGYDVQAIKKFWRRLEYIRSGENKPEMDRDHPTTAERVAAFEETLKEIGGKRQRGELLEPVSSEP